MQGWEAGRFLACGAERHRLILLIMTVRAVTEQNIAEIQRGFEAHLAKPFGRPLRVVSTLLGQTIGAGTAIESCIIGLPPSADGEPFDYTLQLATGALRELTNTVKVGDQVAVDISDEHRRVVHSSFKDGALQSTTVIEMAR